MKIFAFVLTSFLMTNCSLQSPCGNDKDQFLYNFHKFIKDIKDQELAYNDENWEDHDLAFKKYTKECYPQFKEELTRADKEEYFENTMNYYVSKYGEGLAKQYAEDGGIMIEQIAEGIEDWMETEGQDIKSKVEDWLENDGKEIELRIEEWMETEGKQIGRKMEEVFKELEQSIDEEKVEQAIRKFGDFLKDFELNINVEEDKKGNL